MAYIVDSREPCLHCEHESRWHRLDDALNVSPVDPEARFRCLGVEFKGCYADCADFCTAGD